ncbi:ABC transporter substrate-binding protein [Facklamia sp. DSM 111018]|uniref:ABC transporter substrate-binding protein n=1 Tax=Facklamia lactis TaxID=2749967 RepID=A0ABS0LRZ3_9LACT|nr:ABC transporter substrate-binding protein [Facklamia lactis]MBG9981142.1 ABC transporter substrate-binding protein [Facklamia lactis]MBG9986943.1 ABC transporter substrate-binding protein [Facklamia lactis]
MKKFINKTIKLISAATLSLSLFGAFGHGTEANAEDKIELTYWYAFGGNIEKTNLALVEEFNESQDKIHVTAEYQGNYEELHSATQAGIVAGNAPNVTIVEGVTMGPFSRSGILEDLTPLIEADSEAVNVEDFFPALLENSYVDEGMYGLPMFRSTPIFYLNKTLIDESGVKVDDLEQEWTWEDWNNVVNSVGDNTDAAGMSFYMYVWALEGMIQTAGGNMLNEEGTEAIFNQEPGVKLAEHLKAMYEEKKLKVPVGDSAADTAKQDFANQQAAIIVQSTADIRDTVDLSADQGFEIATKFFPKSEQNSVPTGGSNLVMVAGQSEEEKQASWEFMKWMTSTEQTITASQGTGYLVTRQSAADSDVMQEFYKEYPQFQVALDQLKYGKGRPMVEGYSEAEKIIGDAYYAIIVEGAEIQETLDAAAEEVNALIAQ